MELPQPLLPPILKDLPTTDEPVNILIVDDSRTNLFSLEATLSVLGHNLVPVESGEAALQRLDDYRFAVILLDVQMPGLDGFETAARIRAREASKHTPLIFLTASERAEWQVFQGYALGAVDYLLKPFVPEILTAKVRAFVELFQKSEQLQRHTELLGRQTSAFQNILNCMAEGVLVVDGAGHLVLINPAGEQILGHGLTDAPQERWPEVLGRYALDGTTPFPADQMPLVRALRGEASDEVEMFIRNEKRPESAFVSVTARPLCDEQGNHCGGVAVVRDVTERRRAEEEVRRLNAELQSRNRDLQVVNEELEAFSYSVSHDLRAPLRSIDGFGQALWEDYGDKLDAQAVDYLQRVRAAAQRMGQLIDGLLELARVARADLHTNTVDLSGLARHVAAELRESAPERTVEFVIAPNLHARGDPCLLCAVLDNLLGNAWKYTSKHERARIEFGQRTAPNGMVAFFVRDDGAGFDMTYAAKLFGTFQRLHGQTEFPGNGIGLATVQRIVHRHGGRIWADGAPEQGAVFWFTL